MIFLPRAAATLLVHGKSFRNVRITARALAITALLAVQLGLPTSLYAESAVSTTTSPSAPARPLVPIGSGDVVNVQVFNRPELNGTITVAEDGTITLPLVGPVSIQGLSSTAAAQKIAAALKNGQILRNPQVTVLLTQSRSQLVSVLGEVRTPGRFAVDSTMTILDLLAQAGGTTERSGNVMFLIRANGTETAERRAIDLRGLQSQQYSLQLLTLRGGDSIFVPPAEQFYVYGEVNAPNMYRLEPEMTVLQAITRGGGLTKFSSGTRVEIKRRDDTGQLVTRKIGLNERVQADDVIHVKGSVF
jgi:polysaccharide export outer membrane protein